MRIQRLAPPATGRQTRTRTQARTHHYLLRRLMSPCVCVCVCLSGRRLRASARLRNVEGGRYAYAVALSRRVRVGGERWRTYARMLMVSCCCYSGSGRRVRLRKMSVLRQDDLYARTLFGRCRMIERNYVRVCVCDPDAFHSIMNWPRRVIQIKSLCSQSRLLDLRH